MNNDEKHIEFISYTGKYPALCYGVLTLKIDNEEVAFGFDLNDRDLGGDFPIFWNSGGCCTLNDDYSINASKGKWKINEDEIPEKYQKYSKELKDIINENVPWGCCGGCE